MPIVARRNTVEGVRPLKPCVIPVDGTRHDGEAVPCVLLTVIMVLVPPLIKAQHGREILDTLVASTLHNDRDLAIRRIILTILAPMTTGLTATLVDEIHVPAEPQRPVVFAGKNVKHGRQMCTRDPL